MYTETLCLHVGGLYTPYTHHALRCMEYKQLMNIIIISSLHLDHWSTHKQMLQIYWHYLNTYWEKLKHHNSHYKTLYTGQYISGHCYYWWAVALLCCIHLWVWWHSVGCRRSKFNICSCWGQRWWQCHIQSPAEWKQWSGHHRLPEHPKLTLGEPYLWYIPHWTFKHKWTPTSDYAYECNIVFTSSHRIIAIL